MPFLVDPSGLELKRTKIGQKISIFVSENWPAILITCSHVATPCQKWSFFYPKCFFSAVCGPIRLILEYVSLQRFLSSLSRSNCQNRIFVLPKMSVTFIYRRFLAYFGLFWPILAYFGLFWPPEALQGCLWVIWGCPGVIPGGSQRIIAEFHKIWKKSTKS